jgi:hypothetical protein
MLRNHKSFLASVALAGVFCAAAWAKDKPEAILSAAKKSADRQAWSVQAHVNAVKSMKISGIIFGKDFDLTIETLDGVTRQITVGDKSWESDDDGKTWKAGDAADRRFYFLVHTPIKFHAEEKIPPFEAVGTEKIGDQSLLHIRFLAPDKVQYDGDRPNYWVAVRDRQAPVIRRYFGPAAFENNYVDDRVDYAPVADKNPIQPPPGNPQAVAPAAGPERLLMAAMKKMTSGVWDVSGTVTFKKTIKIHGLLEGEDFDLTMEPGLKPDVPMRQISIKDQAWISSDGKTWHGAGANDRLVYNFAHTPILYGRLEPPFEKVGTEERDGATWLHIQLQVADAKVDAKGRPQYWLVLDADGQALYIGHAEIPLVSRGSTDVTYCAFDYAPAKDRIAPPPADAMKPAATDRTPTPDKGDLLAAPLDDKVRSFQEIEAHKFDWADKIVRVEVTPMLLQAVEISPKTYRAMLKDSSESAAPYGQVEFPGDALVGLGFLKKTVSGGHTWKELDSMGALGRTEGAPVSVYVRVVPIGQKPAARLTAVGTKFSPGDNGQGSYTW